MVPVNQNHKDCVSPLWMALLTLHNQPLLSPRPTWLRQSLWMKYAVNANVLLCFIGYSESFWTRILKINATKAFLTLATYKDQRQLQPIPGFVKQPDVTAQPQVQTNRCILIKLCRACVITEGCFLCKNVNYYPHTCEGWTMAALWGSESKSDRWSSFTLIS